jgi:hypothetical protein
MGVSVVGKAPPVRLYDKSNDVVRIDRIHEFDSHVAVATKAFLRGLGIGHVFSERIAPTLEQGNSQVFIAVRDRPWPPWGLRARRIGALCQVHPVGNNSVGLSPIYIADEDATNIGLHATLYKEILDALSRKGGTEVNYLVIEGSVFGDRLLRRVGFVPSDDLLVTETHRYVFYRADAAKLRDALGLDRVSVPELLAHELDESTFDQLASYFSGLHLASQPSRVSDRLVREIIWIDGGLFDAALPCGTPPSRPTARVLPPDIEIDPARLPDGP